MEMNTRIQVEHPVTEEVIDHDLDQRTDQNRSSGEVILQEKITIPNAHAIECRINAEDPFNGFRPSPGKH